MKKAEKILSIAWHYLFFFINAFYVGVCVLGCFKNADILINILMLILPLTCAVTNIVIATKKVMAHEIPDLLRVINFFLSFGEIIRWIKSGLSSRISCDMEI